MKKSFTGTRLAVALVPLLVGCTDARHPTASEPAAPTILAAVQQPGCDVGRLLGAINAANATPGTTITLAAGCTYVLAAVDNLSAEFGANGLPLITRSMTINGNGATITRGSGAPQLRFIYVLGATVAVTLNDLTLSGGDFSNFGGALFNDQATITLNRVKLLGNNAGDGGGGLYNQSGTVYINAGRISGNWGGDWGGGVANAGGTMVIRNSTVSANRSEDSGGGLINVGGTVTVTANTIISGNQAADDGGGLANYGAGTLDIQASTISGNSALDDGGGVSNDAGTVRVHTSLISKNSAQDAGGGLRNENGGDLTVEKSTLSANEAAEYGGGLHNSDGTATVIRSTISGNTATWGGGVGNESGGLGGILAMESSTLSGNRALEAGGGVFNDAGGRFTLANSTVTRNTASVNGGGGMWSFNDIEGRAEVQGSIIAGNVPEDVAAGEEKTRFTSLGYNLIGTAGAYVDFVVDFRAAGDRRDVADPRLGPLGNNGGPTLTHATLAGSPALNTGGKACPATDQRIISRPRGTACEIGAFEGGKRR